MCSGREIEGKRRKQRLPTLWLIAWSMGSNVRTLGIQILSVQYGILFYPLFLSPLSLRHRHTKSPPLISTIRNRGLVR